MCMELNHPNPNQYLSPDGKVWINAAEWYDERLRATRHGWTVSVNNRSLGKFATLREAKQAAQCAQ
jgi:hypothetical protein